MTGNQSLAFTPGYELAERIRAKEVSPVEIVDYLLQRIRALDPQLKAFLTVSEEQARAAAKEAEEAVMRGDDLPPLHGVPIAIKDMEFTKGIRTTGASLLYDEFVPDEDAVVVERLKQAGAIVLGKSSACEFALGGGLSYNRLLNDDSHNPWDLSRSGGASSGGSGVAVAAGLVPLATGSDAGGSTRIPASWTGTFGVKETQGLVPTVRGHCVMPLFLAIGPLTRTVRDAALMIQAMAGYHPEDSFSLRDKPPDLLSALDGDVKGLRVAWTPELFDTKTDPEVWAVAEAAARVFESLGCQVEEAKPVIDDPYGPFSTILIADSVAGHLQDLDQRGEDFTNYLRSVLEDGRKITGPQYAEALWAHQRIRMQMAEFFQQYDLWLTPTMAMKPYNIQEQWRAAYEGPLAIQSLYELLTFCFIANLSGGPSASIPCGFTSDGLPVGLQITGDVGADVKVLRASAAFERAQPWIHHVPPIAEAIP